jgi:hypothetical protein
MQQKQLGDPLVLKSVYRNSKKKGRKWCEELREENTKDID